MEEIQEGEFEEIPEVIVAEDESDEPTTEEPATPVNKKGKLARFLAAISAAVGAGSISPQQATQMRLQMGVTRGYFTRNRGSKRRKAKLAQQKASRKANRGHVKGQSNLKGARHRMNG